MQLSQIEITLGLAT